MRRKIFWLQTTILAIALILSVNEQHGSALPSQQIKAAGFEYKIVPMRVGDIAQGETILVEYDRQGWELIAIQSLRTAATNLSFSAQEGASVKYRLTGAFKVSDRRDESDALYIFKRAKVR